MKRLIALTFAFSMWTAPVRAGNIEFFTVLNHEIARFAVDEAHVDAARAIEIARESADQPVFTMVELIMDGPTPVFEVLYISDAGPAEIEIDARTGKIIPRPPQPALSKVHAEAARMKAALSRAAIDLPGAVEIAASRVKGGRVVKARAEVVKDVPAFNVEVLDNGVFKNVKLGADGKVTEVTPSNDEPGGRAWTFDLESERKPPAGWSFGYTHPNGGKARWTVDKDPKSMTGPHALHLAAQSAGRVFNLAIVKATSYEDVDLRTRLRPNTGKIDQGGGLVWRCKDFNNYYVCRINPLESNFRVYNVMNGNRHQLQSVNVHTEPGKWYAIRAKMIGDHIMCFLNGAKLLDVHDDAFKDAGMIGLWTKADASSSFDNIAARNGVVAKEDSGPCARPGPTIVEDDDDDDDDDDEH